MNPTPCMIPKIAILLLLFCTAPLPAQTPVAWARLQTALAGFRAAPVADARNMSAFLAGHQEKADGAGQTFNRLEKLALGPASPGMILSARTEAASLRHFVMDILSAVKNSTWAWAKHVKAMREQHLFESIIEGVEATALAKAEELSAAAVSQAGAALVKPAGVSPKALFFGGKWYQPVTQSVSWQEAQGKCLATKGQLATVPNEATWNFLTLLGGSGWFWLGATDEVKSGEWRWVDGSALSFKAWADRQPDNFSGKEHYLLGGWNGRWNDGPLDGMTDGKKVSRFICEWGGGTGNTEAPAPQTPA